MNTTTAFKTITLPLNRDMEIQVGKESRGFFYQILELSTLRVLDVKDGLTEGLLFEAVSCALVPEFKTQLLTLLKTL